MIEVIPDFTKSDIENQWNQVRQLEDVIVAEVLILLLARVAVVGVLILICKSM